MKKLNTATKGASAMLHFSPFVAAIAIVAALACGQPSYADLILLSSSPTSIDASQSSNTSSVLWSLPHEGTRRVKNEGSRETVRNDPSDFTIQDQSLGYQSLYADDDFQNLGGEGWVQTEQPPMADGEDSSQLRLTTAPIPLPGAVWLGALGLGSIAWIRRRFDT